MSTTHQREKSMEKSIPSIGSVSYFNRENDQKIHDGERGELLFRESMEFQWRILQDYLVEENFLQIELKRLKSLLHNSSEITCSLEQQQIELQKV